MIRNYLQIETRSFVFIGDFNPSIFQPAWLASKNLIQELEAENAKIDVIMNELSRFQLGEWLSVEVSRNRCEFKTMKSPYFSPIKDLASNVFKILKETPIKAVGINNIYDLSLKSEDDYYKFGNILAPLTNWTEVLDNPRLLNIEFVENNENNKQYLKRIRISPSDPNLKVNFGINFNINNHFILEPNKKVGYNAASLIEEKDDFCAENSRNIVSNILSKVF